MKRRLFVLCLGCLGACHLAAQAAGRISAADPRHFMQPVEPGRFAEEIQALESSGAVALLQSGYAITRRSLQAALRQLIATRQTTCLFVTHDVDEALALGRRLFVMQAGRVARQWNAPWRADEARSQIVQALRAADAASALSVSTAAPVSPVSFP